MDDSNLEGWEVMHDLSCAIFRLSNGESSISSNLLQKTLLKFVKTMPKDNVDLAASRVNKFTLSCVPVAIVLQYLSPDEGIKEYIKQSVQTFINAIRSLLPEPISTQSVPIVLEFCKSLGRYTANDDHLYKFCRTSLAEMVNRAEKVHVRCYSSLQYRYQFGQSEFVSKISDGLILSMEPVNGPGPTSSDVAHFRAFLRPLIGLIKDHVSLPIQMPICCKHENLTNLVKFIHLVYDDLLMKLSGNKVSLEDIKDADPFLYKSCHQILEMDPTEIDQNALGLTFVWEIQASGVMKVAELCPDGKNIIVNSKNRNEYVDLLIQYRFMTSVSERITNFAQGFTDIVGEERIQKLCFRCLEVEDFDGMLYGSESDINVQDWKNHTSYHGFSESDPHICWFWKIVEKMSVKQQKALLYFWTSITHLPIEGFCGLPTRLNIYKSVKSIHHLPSSHTCFYQIRIPDYPSMSVMQERLNIITQEHVGYSFGIA